MAENQYFSREWQDFFREAAQDPEVALRLRTAIHARNELQVCVEQFAQKVGRQLAFDSPGAPGDLFVKHVVSGARHGIIEGYDVTEADVKAWLAENSAKEQA